MRGDLVVNVPPDTKGNSVLRITQYTARRYANTLDKSQVLYQLSYRGALFSRLNIIAHYNNFVNTFWQVLIANYYKTRLNPHFKLKGVTVTVTPHIISRYLCLIRRLMPTQVSFLQLHFCRFLADRHILPSSPSACPFCASEEP